MRTLDSRDFLAKFPSPATDKSFPRSAIETQSPFEPRPAARDSGKREEDELTQFEERLSEVAAACAVTPPGAATSTSPNAVAPAQTESGSVDYCATGAGNGLEAFGRKVVDTSTLIDSQLPGRVEQPIYSLAAPLPPDPIFSGVLAGTVESAAAVSTNSHEITPDDPLITYTDTLPQSLIESRKDETPTTSSGESTPSAATPQSNEAGQVPPATPVREDEITAPAEQLVESRHDFGRPAPVVQDGRSDTLGASFDLSRLRGALSRNDDASLGGKQQVGANSPILSFRTDPVTEPQNDDALRPEPHADTEGHLLRLATALHTPGGLEIRRLSADDDLELDSSTAGRETPSDSAELSLANLPSTEPKHAMAEHHPLAAESPSTPTVAEQLFGEITTRIDLSRREGRIDFRLQLDPPGMGKVHVHLTATEFSVTAQLVAEDSAARQALASQLHTLRDSLANLGVSLENSGLSRDESGSRGGELWQHPAPPAPIFGMPAHKPAQAATHPQNRLKTSGIDVVG